MQIGFVSQDPRAGYWNLVDQFLRDSCAEQEVTLLSRSSFSLAEQVAAVDRMVALGMDAIIIGPHASTGLGPAVERAAAAGIPVVAIDTELADAPSAVLVRADNELGACQAAAYAIARAGGRVPVAILGGPEAFVPARERAAGARRAAAEAGATVVADRFCKNWNDSAGREAMGAVLKRHPEVRVVCAGSDGIGVGAWEAIAAAGRADDILVVGFDAAEYGLLALHGGKLAASVHQPLKALAAAALECAARAVRGEPQPRQFTVPTQLVTRETLILPAIEMLGAIPNLTRRLAALSDPHAHEYHLLGATFDALADTQVYLKSREGHYIFANRAYCEAIGVARDDLNRRTDFDMLPRDQAERAHSEELEVIRSGRPLPDRVEDVIVRGERRALLCSLGPLRDPDGTVVGVVATRRDITALRRAEEERARLQDEIIRAQESMLRELSTPLIPISERVHVMPLIGSIDTRRAQQVIDALLKGIAGAASAFVIIDITGVPVVDTQVANVLLRAAQAVRLLGAHAIITGIRPEVAQTLVGLGVDLRGVQTLGTLQAGVAFAMRR